MFSLSHDTSVLLLMFAMLVFVMFAGLLEVASVVVVVYGVILLMFLN